MSNYTDAILATLFEKIRKFNSKWTLKYEEEKWVIRDSGGAVVKADRDHRQIEVFLQREALKRAPTPTLKGDGTK